MGDSVYISVVKNKSFLTFVFSFLSNIEKLFLHILDMKHKLQEIWYDIPFSKFALDIQERR